MLLPAKSTLSFLRQHLDADPLKLLLQQKKYPDVDMRFVAQQLEGLKQAQDKWQTLAQCDDFLYPPKLNREQSSSEITARYKAGLIPPQCTLADLTGGMGIDSIFFSHTAAQVDYLEMDTALSALSAHNFEALGCSNINVYCADALQWLPTAPIFDVIYADPSRRNVHGQRVKTFEDCTPNLLANIELISTHCKMLLVKASPMIDIASAITQLGNIAHVHVVAVEGECKEVLFVRQNHSGEPQIHCLDLYPASGRTCHYTFTPTGEAAANVQYAQHIGKYLYEPNAALMKGGAFHSISEWFGLSKLGRNTHLYTSVEPISDFPGRTFEVLAQLSLTAKEVKNHIPDGRCHLLCKNYFVDTATLQKQLKLHEGGTQFLIATQLGAVPIGLLCQRVEV